MPQTREGGKEVVDRRTLAGTAPRLAIVDKVDAQQPLAGGRVALDDRFTVKAADQLPVGVGRHRCRP
jgi:hypothetical protein